MVMHILEIILYGCLLALALLWLFYMGLSLIMKRDLATDYSTPEFATEFKAKRFPNGKTYIEFNGPSIPFGMTFQLWSCLRLSVIDLPNYNVITYDYYNIPKDKIIDLFKPLIIEMQLIDKTIPYDVAPLLLAKAIRETTQRAEAMGLDKLAEEWYSRTRKDIFNGNITKQPGDMLRLRYTYGRIDQIGCRLESYGSRGYAREIRYVGTGSY